jgi:hypothetical protein
MTQDKYNPKKSENPENNSLTDQEIEEEKKRFKFDKEKMYKIKYDF